MTEGKNTPHDKIAAKLEQGADIVKSVYRYVHRHPSAIVTDMQ